MIKNITQGVDDIDWISEEQKESKFKAYRFYSILGEYSQDIQEKLERFLDHSSSKLLSVL
jgi:hypothetical protein